MQILLHQINFSKRILIMLSLIITCGFIQGQEPQKPNVVFVLLDDLGFSQTGYMSQGITEADLDPLFVEYTAERYKTKNSYTPQQAIEFARRATPTIDKMASEGVIFSNAYAASNLCAPSRIAIATGTMPNKLGIYTNTDCEARGPNKGALLVQNLKDSGYATAHIGKWHVGRQDPNYRKQYRGSTHKNDHPYQHGFDYYYGYNMYDSPFYNADNVWEGYQKLEKNPKYNTDLFTDKALEFMQQSIEGDKPFYVQLHLHAVHAPLNPKAPDNYFKQFNSDSYLLNNFYAHIYGVDQNIKRVKTFLQQHNIDDNTIIIFTSDNGGSVGWDSPLPGNAPYRGHKGMYLLGGIRVPMFISWPKGIPKAHEEKNLVSTIDIIPTVLSAAGVDIPEGIDGKDLTPYLSGTSKKPVRNHYVCSGIHSWAWGFMCSHSFHQFNETRKRATFASVVIKEGYLWRYVGETVEHLYKEYPDGRPAYYEMYNIKNDPQERDNKIDSEKKKAKQLKSIWKQESSTFPPPQHGKKDLWNDIINN